jgi:hypothetical protein
MKGDDASLTGATGPPGSTGAYGGSNITQLIIYCTYRINNASNLTNPGTTTLLSISTTPLPNNLSLSISNPSSTNQYLVFTNYKINSSSTPEEKAKLYPSAVSGLGLTDASQLSSLDPTLNYYSYNNNIIISGQSFSTPVYNTNNSTFNLNISYIPNGIFSTDPPAFVGTAAAGLQVILGILNVTFDSTAF